MPEALLVSSIDASHYSSSAFEVGRHVGLAGRRQDRSPRQVSVQSEEALDIHMQVLSNRFAVGIPASDLVRQAEREGVNRRWGADPRAGIQAGDATRAPLDV